MKKYIIAAASVLIFVPAYWLLAPYFTTVTVDDELPALTQNSDESTSVEAGAITEELFPIIDTPGHPASGNIRIVTSAEQSVVRYENYMGTNGPDLFVYLAKDLEATEFVSLGRARGNSGNINYEVPAEIDLSEYAYVMTWCRAFGELFDYAEIN